ncbi:TPA: NusA-like transcription termination signal-binding factor [Candidatus Woesearchaeota archaeon]|nr:NusA-like transcription termination signal-binding factor [Candidatus Woesearchaeota archaeon]HII68585.1 NusA-like transcription termination signal-binding factor [Candidatus Woesearchaeota archaeon]
MGQPKRTFDAATIKYISLFSSVTHADVRDLVIHGDAFLFIVAPSQVGRAVGKQGANVKKISAMLKKPVHIIEYSDNVCQFIGNMLYPERPDGITEEDGIITIHAPDARIKGKIYGRDRTRLKFVADVVKRQFPVKELKVV